MKKNTTIFNNGWGLLFLMAILLPQIATAQDILNTAGGSHSFSGEVHEYSIGEMTVISTDRNSEMIATQGVLQIEDVSLGVPEEAFAIHDLTVYPNPTKGEIHIKPALGKPGTLSLKVYDILGKLVVERTAHLQTGYEEQTLDLSSLSEATYMLDIVFFHGKHRYHNNYKILKSSI